MRLIPLLLLGAALCGCASVGRKIDQSKVEQIQRGVSTREDVRKLIGSLDSMTKDSDRREIWTYFYSSATSKPESFIPIVGAFAGGVNMRTQHTMIFFGEDGKVERYTSSTGELSQKFCYPGGVERKSEMIR